MELKRPLASLDLETTGTDPATSRVVEVGVVKRYHDGREDVFRWLVNPEVTIPSESIRVHGYTNEIARSSWRGCSTAKTCGGNTRARAT